MLDVVFVCVMGTAKKEIKVEKTQTRVENSCKVYVDSKVVGSAKHGVLFCDGLATKVQMDMEKKGYEGEPPVKK